MMVMSLHIVIGKLQPQRVPPLKPQQQIYLRLQLQVIEPLPLIAEDAVADEHGGVGLQVGEFETKSILAGKLRCE